MVGASVGGRVVGASVGGIVVGALVGQSVLGLYLLGNGPLSPYCL